MHQHPFEVTVVVVIVW